MNKNRINTTENNDQTTNQQDHQATYELEP